MKPFAIVFAILSAFVLSANAADTFKVDPVHSFVLFSVQHLGIANTYGRFNDISGNVVFDKDNPSKSSVELSVQVESLDTHNSIRERSLKSPDFFDVKQRFLLFPRAAREQSLLVSFVLVNSRAHNARHCKSLERPIGVNSRTLSESIAPTVAE